MFSSVDEWETEIDLRPLDMGLRLAFSDWLEDVMEMYDRAAFVRWQVANKKVPAFNPSTEHNTPWGWDRGPHSDWPGGGWNNMDMISAALYERLPAAFEDGLEIGDSEGRENFPDPTGPPTSWFKSRRSAEAALFAAWVAAGRPAGLE